MNPNVQLWIDALRSGKYLQGKRLLEDNAGNLCCLGVACKIAKKHGVEVKNSTGGKLWGFNLDTQLAVKEWLGLKDRNGGNDEHSDLTSLNDMGKTFAEIADIIESNPKGLFNETISTVIN